MRAGILNKHWTHVDENGVEDLSRNGTLREVGPETQPSAWRHAMPVIDGIVKQWTGEGVECFLLSCLWINADGVSVDVRKGFLRKILKVWKVSPKAVVD